MMEHAFVILMVVPYCNAHARATWRFHSSPGSAGTTTMIPLSGCRRAMRPSNVARKARWSYCTVKRSRGQSFRVMNPVGTLRPVAYMAST
jgi:hypothetical protein